MPARAQPWWFHWPDHVISVHVHLSWVAVRAFCKGNLSTPGKGTDRKFD